jgi:hypothetical protein
MILGEICFSRLIIERVLVSQNLNRKWFNQTMLAVEVPLFFSKDRGKRSKTQIKMSLIQFSNLSSKKEHLRGLRFISKTSQI